MVKQKKILIVSPAIFAAFTVAFLLYSGLLKTANPHVFSCLIPPEKIKYAEGFIASNPIKTASGRFYSASFETSSAAAGAGAETGYSNFTSACSGRIQLLVPAETVEALYPGKLFTAAGLQSREKKTETVPAIEQGAVLAVSGLRFLPPDKIQKTGGGSQYPVFIAEALKQGGWTSMPAQIRWRFRLELKRILYAWEDAGGLLLALIAGSREYTNPSLAEGFKNAGLSHLLALSGMHLSVFAGFAAFLGKLLNFFGRKKKPGNIFSLAAMFIFVWFAGLSPSLCRALLCTLISAVLAAYFLKTQNSFFSMLSLAFLLQTVFFPQDIYTAAFMLSYAAFAGIGLADRIFKPLFAPHLPSFLVDTVSASFGAQLCTAPVTIYLFGSIMPIGLIASVIISPLVLYFLLIGLVFIALSICMPFLLYPLSGIIQGIYVLIKWGVLWFARFPPITFL